MTTLVLTSASFLFRLERLHRAGTHIREFYKLFSQLELLSQYDFENRNRHVLGKRFRTFSFEEREQRLIERSELRVRNSFVISVVVVLFGVLSVVVGILGIFNCGSVSGPDLGGGGSGVVVVVVGVERSVKRFEVRS